MKYSLKQRRIFSILFLVGYIFVTFFAQQFHHHEHSSDVSETNETVVKSSLDHDAECLVCHFIHEVKYLSDGESHYDFYIPQQYTKVSVSHHWAMPFSTVETRCLRGPPAKA